MLADTAPIRPGEELDTAALAVYLADKLPGAADALTVEQFPGGHSNLTYLVSTPVRDYVLRRGPLGPVPPKAHDMSREFRVLEAVHPFFPPAPRVYLLCEDLSVLGAIFFIMERREGSVIRSAVPPELTAAPEYPALISAGFIDCLAQLHAVDIDATGLHGLGKPAGFLERQVKGWFERWQHAKTQEIPAMDRVISWLAGHLPRSPAPTLVHNDFKLDNILLDPVHPGRVEAVLDWEMSTVGDPLVDLGLILCYWSQPSDPGGDSPALTSGPGWFTPDQLIHRYATQTGRDVSRISYYYVFALFKLAVVLQQIFFRFHRGQTQDERFRCFDRRVQRLIDTAASLL